MKKFKRCLIIIISFAVLVSAFVLVDSKTETFNRSVSDNSLMLVNYDHRLPLSYNTGLTQLSNGQRVSDDIYPSLQKMFDDMRAEGIYPTVASGYRTAHRQRVIMKEKIDYLISQGYSKKDAKAQAKNLVSKVGHSEHQTGLAVDIGPDPDRSTSVQVYDWLKENAWKYGFILRYPENKTGITHIDYEPWHYRYVGKKAACEIYEKGICLEEYLEGNGEVAR